MENISFIMVFLEGLLSFLSPCVLPLIPLYMAYLSGNGRKTGEDGTITYVRSKVFINTICFIAGISTSFFIMGISFSTLGSFFNEHRSILGKIGGILIIILGLFQIGLLNIKFLQREKKLALNLENKAFGPLTAYVMGFTFSFAWTPCVGPMLSSVLILASNTGSTLTGNLLVITYSIGFVLPFLFLGLFTGSMLNFLGKRKNLVKYTVKAGGVIMIIMGFLTFTGFFTALPYADTNDTTTENQISESQVTGFKTADDFTLTDQSGSSHSLSQYKDKVVFINFWATWCYPCRGELPYIEELYEEYGENKDDVVFLTITAPGGREKDKAGITSFLEENQYSFPALFDEDGTVFNQYNVTALPTTFVINSKGEIFGHVAGALEKEQMEIMIKQAK